MKIIGVTPGSQAALQGLRAGDIVVGVVAGPARDIIDLMFYGGDEEVKLTIHRGNYEFVTAFRGDTDYGIEFEDMKIRGCGNNCVFCFIDQNPKGMRESVYFHDEDYRLSFLHGSYITLTNLGTMELQRIVRQRLSPLFVSVHALDPAVRIKLLGLKKPDNLVEKMGRLLSAGIRMHTQIVVCPGINDGEVLEQTITGLRALSQNVLSIAVVPVGLTKHRDDLYPLVSVNAELARKTVSLVDRLHNLYREETDEGFVYCADEWYLRAGIDIPEAEYYDDFPQLENGIGMVRQFLDKTKELEMSFAGVTYRKGKFVLVTGMSMAGILEDFSRRISAFPGIEARTVAVQNSFYGDSVTVSGLLAGRDILAALHDVEPDEIVVLPPECLNNEGRFLDDMLPGDIERYLNVQVLHGELNPLDIFL